MWKRALLVIAFLQSTVALGSDCYKADVGHCATEKAMFDATNNFRAQNGLPPLQYKRELQWSARKWSEKMAKTGRVDHEGFPTTRNETILLEFPASKIKVHGENCAGISRRKPNDFGEYIVSLWIRSRGHRANMLRHFRYMGVGFARDGRGGYYGTQNFSW